MFAFLYKTVPGRIILKLLTRPWISVICGKFMSCPISRIIIPGFIRKNGIDISEYRNEKYRCFNDFFTRRVLPEKRPIDMAPESLVSPCDGLLSAYQITENSTFTIKRCEYSIPSLLRESDIASDYRDGICLIFRLDVGNYHRYHFFDSGTQNESRYIPGVLHTVRPVAVENTDVFIQNSREVTMLSTDNFGDVAEIEVGALLVGKIVNLKGIKSFSRGDEKGYFMYGGSTVILLFKKDTVEIEDSVFQATRQGREIPVKMGQTVGHAK